MGPFDLPLEHLTRMKKTEGNVKDDGESEGYLDTPAAIRRMNGMFMTMRSRATGRALALVHSNEHPKSISSWPLDATEL